MTFHFTRNEEQALSLCTHPSSVSSDDPHSALYRLLSAQNQDQRWRTKVSVFNFVFKRAAISYIVNFACGLV